MKKHISPSSLAMVKHLQLTTRDWGFSVYKGQKES